MQWKQSQHLLSLYSSTLRMTSDRQSAQTLGFSLRHVSILEQSSTESTASSSSSRLLFGTREGESCFDTQQDLVMEFDPFRNRGGSSSSSFLFPSIFATSLRLYFSRFDLRSRLSFYLSICHPFQTRSTRPRPFPATRRSTSPKILV